MSTTARKARKRAGDQFVRIPKVGTPLEDRTVQPAFDTGGRQGPVIAFPHQSNRGVARLTKLIKARDAGKPEAKAKKGAK